MTTWNELRNKLNISEEDEALIALERDLIRTLVALREEQGMSQAELASKCGVKQPMIARMEKSIHSPQVDSLLKVLLQLGYTLKIVPLSVQEEI
ncbi:MAG: helix-turn-helix transcriptional regulator [Lachnospiraceae bacterium]|nr:helix-turn-helix transcriptional regulator [Lachnospiraceae bacterium]